MTNFNYILFSFFKHDKTIFFNNFFFGIFLIKHNKKKLKMLLQFFN